MNFNFRPRVVRKQNAPRFNIGDEVVVVQASNASLNLYSKAKQLGLTYIHCPCNAKPNVICVIRDVFSSGYLLEMQGKLTVAYPTDLQKV